MSDGKVLGTVSIETFNNLIKNLGPGAERVKYSFDEGASYDEGVRVSVVISPNRTQTGDGVSLAYVNPGVKVEPLAAAL